MTDQRDAHRQPDPDPPPTLEPQQDQTPVSDEAEPSEGSGTHGRPSDDTDPGHS